MVPACGPLSGINLNTRRIHMTDPTKRITCSLLNCSGTASHSSDILLQGDLCPELTPHSNYGLTTHRKKTQPFYSCFEEKNLRGRCVLKDRLCPYGSKIIILLSDLLQISRIILDGVHCLWTLFSRRWCWDAYARGEQWEIVHCASMRYRNTLVSSVRDI